MEKKNDYESLIVLRAKDVCYKYSQCIQDYVAFGDWTDVGSEPCIFFDGGSEFTGCLQNAPKLRFNIYGECSVVYYEWMNSNNCPNAYDDCYIKTLTNFVQLNLPVLYLVYNCNLDKEDALSYFKGLMDWNALLGNIYRIPENTYSGVTSCKNSAQLHTFCVCQQIYGAYEHQLPKFKPLLCKALGRQLQPLFEKEFSWDQNILVGYNGDAENVFIPDGIDRIDDYVFAGHTEIKRIFFPKSLHEIGTGAFEGCTGLERLSLPSSVTMVEAKAFAGCRSLHSVYFEESVDGHTRAYTAVGDGAFSDCTELTDVHIPADMILEEQPFDNCPNLTIRCTSGSCAEQYAIQNQIPYK